MQAKFLNEFIWCSLQDKMSKSLLERQRQPPQALVLLALMGRSIKLRQQLCSSLLLLLNRLDLLGDRSQQLPKPKMTLRRRSSQLTTIHTTTLMMTSPSVVSRQTLARRPCCRNLSGVLDAMKITFTFRFFIYIFSSNLT